MTKDEFNDWLAFHIECFPGIRPWLKKQKDAQGVLHIWRQGLERLTLKAAKDASFRMFADPAVTLPQGFGQHPRAILGLCADDYEGQHQTGRRGCELCQGSGTRFVIHGQLMQLAAEVESFEQFQLKGARYGAGWVKACDCELGLHLRTWRKYPRSRASIPPMAPYNPVMDIEMSHSLSLLDQWNLIQSSGRSTSVDADKWEP